MKSRAPSPDPDRMSVSYVYYYFILYCHCSLTLLSGQNDENCYFQQRHLWGVRDIHGYPRDFNVSGSGDTLPPNPATYIDILLSVVL